MFDLPRRAEAKVAWHLLDRRADPSSKEGKMRGFQSEQPKIDGVHHARMVALSILRRLRERIDCAKNRTDQSAPQRTRDCERRRVTRRVSTIHGSYRQHSRHS